MFLTKRLNLETWLRYCNLFNTIRSQNHRYYLNADTEASLDRKKNLTYLMERNMACHKLIEIFQKVTQNFSKSCSKVAPKQVKSCSVFVTKVAQRLVEENKNPAFLLV